MEDLRAVVRETMHLLRVNPFDRSVWLPCGKDGKRRLELSQLVFIRPKRNSITTSEVQLQGQKLMDWHCGFADLAEHLQEYLANQKQFGRPLFLSKGRSDDAQVKLDRQWIINHPYLVSYKTAGGTRHKSLTVEWRKPGGTLGKQSFLMTHHYWSTEGGREWVENTVYGKVASLYGSSKIS